MAISVGKKPITFQVPERLLCQKSKFFERALCCDKWKEGQNKAVVFEEDDPAVFDEFLRWLYGWEIDVTENEDGALELEPLIQLYAFADKISCVSCKKEIVTKLYKCFLKRDLTSTSSDDAFEKMVWVSDGFTDMVKDWFWSTFEPTHIDSEWAAERPTFTAEVLLHVLGKLWATQCEWRRYKKNPEIPTPALDALNMPFESLKTYLSTIV